jgi:N-acetylmuramoyl-L-alanine amidase
MAFGMEAAAQSCASKPAKDIVVALDVGHVAGKPGDECTRSKPCSWGATSARGVPEYDFNLALALDMREAFVRAGYPSTIVLTTELRGVRGLWNRAARANAARADIFLSIHHDAVRDRFLKTWQVDGVERGHYDDAQGFSLHVSRRLADSLKLARLVGDELLKAGLRFTTHHEPAALVGASVPYADAKRGIYWRDRLAVLKATRMPAVLLEGGVIVNRDEELLLASETHRQTIASAVVRAVGEYCRPATARADRVVKRANARRRDGD